MKKIPREMKICLWQNVLNVVTGTTKYVQEFPCVFLRIKVSSEMYEMLEDIIEIEKGTKKILHFSS